MPTRSTFSDAAMRGLKPKAKPYKVSDSGGLYVQVNASGARCWRFAYRFEGRQKVLSIGVYPKVGLKAARDARDAAKEALDRGEDPSTLKKAAARREAEEEAAAAVVAEIAAERRFKAVAERWFASRKDAWVETYATRIWSRIAGDILPDLGDLDVGVVTPQQALDAIRKIESRGAVELARRIKNHVSDIFEFAISECLIDSNPTARLNKALKKPEPGQRRKALFARDLPKFLIDLEGYHGERLTQLAIKFALLTVVRTQELRFTPWSSEFEDLDGPEPLWRIPAWRKKMRDDHLVPLSRQAVEVIRQIQAIPRPKSVGTHMLFGSAGPDGQPTRSGVISENCMLFGLYALGYRSKATIHGFRGTFSTIANESGRFHGDWIERQLAHVERDEVRASYNVAEYLKPRREMLQWWGDYLDQQADVGSLVG